ncbi:MAG: hypothetical protein NVSMB7_09710 [Chitinophagaceae bacterium]
MKVIFNAMAVLFFMHAAAQDSTGKYFLAKTTGKLPFLEYGLGDDRLGGAKMTYLDSNIILKVIDSFVKNVFMTRTKDTTLDMPQRIQMLKDYSPDLLISIHLNSADIDTVKGTSTYYRYIGYRPLTVAVLKRMLSLGLKEYGNVGNFNFSLNGPAAYPNCLVEIAFLSNRDDEKKILDPTLHKAVAHKIYLGIQAWLNAIK